jgi:hypothetical protein
MSDRYASLRQGLVGCWIPSISGSGLLLPDLSGRGNNGSLVGMDASDWVSASYGRALDFDGSNDRVTLPNDFQRNAQSGAISAWFKFAGNGANQNPIVSLGGNANLTVFAFRRRDTADASQNAIGLRIFSNNAPGGANTEIFSTDKVNDGVWAHGLIQSNGSKYDLFVNGIRQTMVFTAGSDNGDWLADMTGTTGETICDIGAQWASGALFSSLNGQVDDVRIYSRTLSEPEIKLLASRPGIGLRQDRDRNTFYQFPSGSRRRRILTGMP